MADLSVHAPPAHSNPASPGLPPLPAGEKVPVEVDLECRTPFSGYLPLDPAETSAEYSNPGTPPFAPRQPSPNVATMHPPTSPFRTIPYVPPSEGFEYCPSPCRSRSISPTRSCASNKSGASKPYTPSPKLLMGPTLYDSMTSLPPVPVMDVSPCPLPAVKASPGEVTGTIFQSHTSSRPASVYSLDKPETVRTASHSVTPDHLDPPAFDEAIPIPPQLFEIRYTPPLSPPAPFDLPILQMYSSTLVSGLLGRFTDLTHVPILTQASKARMTDLEIDLLPELAQLKTAIDELDDKLFDISLKYGVNRTNS